jgi:hypothetical protein
VTKDSPLRRAWRRSLFHKLLIVLGAALLVFELIYVVAANALLWTGTIVKAANSSTDDIHLEIRGPCWTMLPGRVHGRDVSFRFQDRNVQFYLTLDEVVLDIRLWQLPGKTFHVTRARGEGARFWMRHKVESAEGLERRLAIYPRIPGFPDPPLITKARTPSLSDEEYNLWTVSFDDVDVAVKELWFLDVRYAGSARATGGFHLEPERDVQTYPCRLEVTSGELFIGPHTIARDFKGTLDVELHRHDPRRVEGAKIFTRFSVNTNLNGTVPGLDATQIYFDAEGPQFSAGQGTLLLRIDLKEGVWSQGSIIEYKTAAIGFRRDDLTVSGPLALRAEITQGGQDSRARIGVDTEQTRLSVEGGPGKLEGPTLQALHAEVSATSDLSNELRVTGAKADLKASAPALRWLNQPLHTRLFSGGPAQAKLRAQWAEGGDGKASLDVDVKRAELSVADQPVVLAGTLDAEAVYDSKSDRGHFDKLRLDLPEFVSSNVPIPGGIHLDGQLRFSGLTPPKRMDGSLELQSETLDPLLPLLIPSDILRGLTKVLADLGKTRARLEFQRNDDKLDLQLKDAKSGDVQGFGMLSSKKNSKGPCAQFYVDGEVSVGVVMLDGETSIEPLVSQQWWRERPDMNTWCNAGKRAKGAQRRAHAR